MIGRLIRMTLGAFIFTTIGTAIAALVIKQRTPSVGTPDSDEIALVSIFEPLDFVSTAKAFRGGSLTCWYGGGDLDLREATLDPAGADLEVRLVFGGGRLLVPDEWDVDLQLTSIFGGAGDMREARTRPADAPRLSVHGLAVFGGLGIDSSKREADIAASVQSLVADHTNGADTAMADAATELIPALDV